MENESHEEYSKAQEQRELVPARHRKYTFAMRVGAFAGGVGFLALAAADAMFDPFPGPETFFAGTGITLIGIGVAGRAPKNGKAT